MPFNASAKSLLASTISLAQAHFMKALFLDAAGTLFDLAEPVGAVYARFARKHGLNLSKEEAESRFRAAFKNLPDPVYEDFEDGHQCEMIWWRDLVLRVTQSADDDDFELFFQDLFSFYEKGKAWKLFPDTVAFLETAHEHFRLAVVSNFDSRLLPVLEELGLSSYFEVIISSAEARSRKPDPQIFQTALRKLNLPADQVLHIGDSQHADYQGARDAGLEAFHLQREKGALLAHALPNHL